MGCLSASDPRVTARFTVRGTDPVLIDVEGVLDAGAAVGLAAVIDLVSGARQLTVDASTCVLLDGVADRVFADAAQRISEHGGVLDLRTA